MREIRIIFKKARKNGVGGAMCELRKEEATYSRCLWKRSYWLITLFFDKDCKGHCDLTSYLKKIPGRKRRKRYLNIHRYIKCLNHEIMHAVLHDVIGEIAYEQWDNIVKTNYGERYQGKRYGGKNIMGAHLPNVYCAEE